MGNCVALSRPNKKVPRERLSKDRKTLQIVRMDGKVLEYKTSVLVSDLLLNFDGCGVGVSAKTSRLLPPDHEMRVGRVYYLLPLDHRSVTKDAEEKGGSGKRIKLVLTKQQLQELLSKKLSVVEVLSEMQRRESQSVGFAASWRPQLETIPEGRE